MRLAEEAIIRDSSNFDSKPWILLYLFERSWPVSRLSAAFVFIDQTWDDLSVVNMHVHIPHPLKIIKIEHRRLG